MEEARNTRLLIVEDEALFSELLRRTLATEPGLEVVGVAHEGRTAVRMAEELEPDAVLMDIELPGDLDGIEAGLQIKSARPETGMVILSAHNDRRYITSLPPEDAPGWSYLLKQTVPDLAMVRRAVEGSLNGFVVLDPAVISQLRPRENSLLARLTPRLREVLELVAQGYNNAAIAGALELTEKSVETYMNGIYQELQVSNEREVHARVRATLIYLKESRLMS